MKIIMMGPQGSGKGTQAKVLSRKLNIPHLSTGDLLRAEVTEGSDIGRQAREIMDAGQLVSDKIIQRILEKRLASEECANGFIADGFPRNLEQLLRIEPVRRVDHAVQLFVDTQTTIERLATRINCPQCKEVYGPKKPPAKEGVCDSCGDDLIKRSDDADIEPVLQRLEIYWTEMAPILRYYDYADVLTTIDGAQSIEAIEATLEKLVGC